MKKLKFAIPAVVVMTITLFSLAMDKTPTEKASYEYLTQVLNNDKAFTLEVLEGMSVEDYTFKPADEMRNFGEQAFHIAYSIEWYNKTLKGTPIAWEPGDENRMSKDELIAYTNEQFDAFIEVVHSAEESGRFTAGVLGALRHTSHHRGQMIAYYRANGMAPPAYK